MRRKITYIWDRKLPHGWHREYRQLVRRAVGSVRNNELKMAGKATHRRRQVIIAAKRARIKKNVWRKQNE